MAVVIQDFEATADAEAGESGQGRGAGAAHAELRPHELEAMLRGIGSRALRRWAH